LRFPEECDVRLVLVKGLFILSFGMLFAGYSLASPLSSRLLPLVPSGAEIVAGFENHPGPTAHRRLLLTTHNNRLDLDDWQSLTGVDSQRMFDEVIEVAASDPAGNLSEHLLLVAGRFDRECIYRSLEQNGSRPADFDGERILLIEPLARERGDMLDTRWLVILGNRTGILGTPELVQQALRRYKNHSVPDSVLDERLSLLRPDVTSWNVLARSPARMTKMVFAQPRTAWAELQQDADLLMIGVRFGSKTRIDFSIDAQGNHEPEFFARKAAFFTDALLAGPHPEAVTAERGQRRPKRFSVRENHANGSVTLSNRQFDEWCLELTRLRMPAAPPLAHGD
jgi:hypothetical protein